MWCVKVKKEKIAGREYIEWVNFWWESANKESKRILLIGDSVTRGYRSKLNKILLAYGYVVDLFAVSMSITDELFMKMLNSFFSVEEYKYDIVCFQVSQHEFAHFNQDERYGDKWIKAYIDLISEVNKRVSNVTFVSLTPNVLKADLKIYDDARNRYLWYMNKKISEMAIKMRALYIDLWDTLLEAEHSDYIHFTEEVNWSIAEDVSEVLIEQYDMKKC